MFLKTIMETIENSTAQNPQTVTMRFAYCAILRQSVDDDGNEVYRYFMPDFPATSHGTMRRYKVAAKGDSIRWLKTKLSKMIADDNVPPTPTPKEKIALDNSDGEIEIDEIAVGIEVPAEKASLFNGTILDVPTPVVICSKASIEEECDEEDDEKEIERERPLEKKRSPGRPKLSEENRATCPLVIKLTADEAARLNEYAKRMRMPKATLVKSMIARLVDQSTTELKL